MRRSVLALGLLLLAAPAFGAATAEKKALTLEGAKQAAAAPPPRPSATTRAA